MEVPPSLLQVSKAVSDAFAAFEQKKDASAQKPALKSLLELLEEGSHGPAACLAVVKAREGAGGLQSCSSIASASLL